MNQAIKQLYFAYDINIIFMKIESYIKKLESQFVIMPF